MFLNIEKHWYKKSYSWLTLLLLPFSWIFYCLVTFRQFCYRIGLKKTTHFSVPVIVVGNITVGGTGKTPFVIWLANFLKTQGFHPGIVSRGVGGIRHGIPHRVNDKSDPKKVGDEALLLAKKTHCPIVICQNRVAAVATLLGSTHCNVVIADDGLQHYRLGRTIEIAIIDGERQWGNGCLLPAGPLRELPNRLKKVDFIITHGKTGDMTMQLHGDTLHRIQDEAKKPLHQLIHTTVHAVAGIGHPARFFDLLRLEGLCIIEHIFPDHYLFKKSDFDFSDDHLIIMTEKDAVKCQSFADERFWYLPVQAIVNESVGKSILKKIEFQDRSIA